MGGRMSKVFKLMSIVAGIIKRTSIFNVLSIVGVSSNLIKSIKTAMSLEKQVVPTKNDIELVRNIAEKLKGLTDAETLNNVLEWQERNIKPWSERAYLIVPLGVVATLELVVILFVTFFYRIILVPPAVFTTTMILAWILFGVLSFAASYLIIVYMSFVGYEDDLRSKLRKIIELIRLTFARSLPLEKMLEYRRGVCRDYAKLSAALLLHLYPGNEVFFFTFLRHAAAGIKIGDRTYVLDQRLPILEPGAWLVQWRKERAKVFKLVKRDGGGFGLEYVGEVAVTSELRRFKGLDLKATLRGVVDAVIRAIDERQDSVDIMLRDYALLFDVENDVIKESLIRKVRMELQNALAGNASKIGEIKALKQDTDVILRIQLLAGAR